jgi:hypothetical protein
MIDRERYIEYVCERERCNERRKTEREREKKRDRDAERLIQIMI